MKNKKIIITSYNFFPENTPRAFRTFELAKEFSRRNYNVTILIPEYNFNYLTLKEHYKQNIIKTKTGFFLNKNSKFIKNKNSGVPKSKRFKLSSKFNNFIKEIIHQIFPEANRFEYGITLSSSLKNIKNDNYDALISIGLPFSVHWGSILGKYRGKLKINKMIAEYGDPFYENMAYNNFYQHYLFEKIVIKKFDYIVVPDQIAIKSYLKFKNKEFIKVIPQGLKFEDIKISQYVKNKIPTFAFAGNLYKKIRDPQNFLFFLSKQNFDFKFIIYTNINNEDTAAILAPFKEKMGEKLIINNKIPRFECINELSKMDFLINIENVSSNQQPSKLIDYGLTERPVLSFSSENFNENLLLDFIGGNYKNQVNIDLEPFKIENVCDKFIELIYG